MGFRKYIKTMLSSPEVARRAKAMDRAKRARKAEVLARAVKMKREKVRKARQQTEAKKVAKSAPYANLEKKLCYKFADKNILKEALTHPSVVGTSKVPVRSNQRLEFLGDAILQSIISANVFGNFDHDDEGELTKIRITLTRGSFLAKLSAALGIPDNLIVPKGSENLRKSASAAEDAFEAVVGAIFLDAGFEKTRRIVLDWYKLNPSELPVLAERQNPKGLLQERAVKAHRIVGYKLEGQSGPDHSKVFTVRVYIDGSPCAAASATSKKAAESAAAAKTMEEFGDMLKADDGAESFD